VFVKWVRSWGSESHNSENCFLPLSSLIVRRFRKSDLVKLELRLNGENVDPLSCIAHRSKAYFVGRELTKKLKQLIPRAQFKIPIQAAIGGKVRYPCPSEQVNSRTHRPIQ
jgi:translation elongation factor EF-4